MTAAIVYAAKSTEDVHGSIPTQLSDCRDLAAREGWDVVGEYQDEASSGWSGDRGPGLAAALAHAAAIAPCHLVVQHSDRLARGDGKVARHLAELFFATGRNNITLRSVQDPSTFDSPLLAVVMGERNVEDSRRKSLSVSAGMKRRAAAGKPGGGPRAFGYQYGPNTLIIVIGEAVIVRRVFAEFLAGRSMSQIARDLQTEGVPTTRGARYWRQSSIGQMLRNPIYNGQRRFQGEVIDANHEAIIDPDTWRRTSELIAARPSRGRGRPSTGLHLFRKGMLKCACGSSLTPMTKGEYQGYYCQGRQNQGRDFCDLPELKRADVDGSVFAYFRQVGLDVEATRQTVADARDRKLAEVRALAADADREAQVADERLARVRADYTDGKIDADDWNAFKADLTAGVDAARAEAARLADQLTEVEGWGELADAEADTYRALADIRAAIAGEVRDGVDLAAVRVVLQRTFSHFVVRQTPPPKIDLDLIGPAYVIDPVVRDRAIEGYGADGVRPVLRREPLQLAENNQRLGKPNRCLFDPIPVGAPD